MKFKTLTVEQVCQRLARLKGKRGTWETHWQEIEDYIVPRKNTINNTKEPGTKRTWQVLDNTGIQSNELLAGMLHSMLTNPDGLWFEFTTGDLALDQNEEVREWMQDSSRRVHNVLNNSNFQTEVHEVYIDIGSIGTSNMLIEEDDETVVRFSTKYIRDYYVAENSRGVIDKSYCEYTTTIEGLVEDFGIDKLPKTLQDKFNKGEECEVKVIHAVYPKKMIDPKNKDQMKFVSQYVLPDEKAEISVSQFLDYPFATPRWSKAPGEVYGRSPGMTALPECKVLNKMNETMLRGAQKLVDPPIQLPDDGFILPLVTTPGGINYYRAGTQERIEPVFNDSRIDFGYQAMEDRRKRVRDAFYVDQLKLQQGGPMMTATEVLQRTEESTRLMGPMLGRMQAEFLRPLVNRVYNIMAMRKMLKPAPEVMRQAKLDVRYSSLIAKAQRIADGQNIMRAVGAIQPFMAIDPSVADIFDGDKSARTIMQIYGTPQELLRKDADIKRIREGRAVAQKEMLAAQQEAAGAAVYSEQSAATKNVASAQKDTTGV